MLLHFEVRSWNWTFLSPFRLVASPLSLSSLSPPPYVPPSLFPAPFLCLLLPTLITIPLNPSPLCLSSPSLSVTVSPPLPFSPSLPLVPSSFLSQSNRPIPTLSLDSPLISFVLLRFLPSLSVCLSPLYLGLLAYVNKFISNSTYKTEISGSV